MIFSEQDKQVIAGTSQFFEALKAGNVDPDYVQDELNKYTGRPDDYPEDYQRRWETLIVGSIASETSQLLGTFPVAIGDYNSKATRPGGGYWSRAGQYVWTVDDRPSLRPKTPHRIEDKTLINLATRNTGKATVEDMIILAMVTAAFEDRSVFEIALLVVFPVWGAYAFRHRINISSRPKQSDFHRMLEQRQAFEEGLIDHDPIEPWIIKHIPHFAMIREDQRDKWVTDAINECSSEALGLVEYLARMSRR